MEENTPLQNPYFDYTIIRDTQMFFGREEDIRLIYEASHRKQSLSIVGPRRIGKSSLLWYAAQREVQQTFAERYQYDLSKHLFVFIDLRDYLHKQREDFFDAVSEQIVRQSQEFISLQLPTSQGADRFSKLLEDLEAEGFCTILLMDSFDKVTKDTLFDINFFSFLRSLATRGRVSYITASLKALYEMSHQAILTSPFFDIFSTRKLGPLSEEAAKQLIEVPTERVGLPFTEEQQAWILDLVGRHPFFLQVACRFLFRELERKPQEGVDLRAVQEQIYEELKNNCFGRLWEDLNEEQRKEVKQEIRQSTSGSKRFAELSESSLFRRYLRDSKEDQLDITVKDLKDALDHIENEDYLSTCKLRDMNYVSIHYELAQTTSPRKRGSIVREFLRSAFENLRPGGLRTDAAVEWRSYNILYYHYFKYHLPNEKTAARLGIGRRQYYREQERALQVLLREVIEIEIKSLNEYNSGAKR